MGGYSMKQMAEVYGSVILIRIQLLLENPLSCHWHLFLWVIYTRIKWFSFLSFYKNFSPVGTFLLQLMSIVIFITDKPPVQRPVKSFRAIRTCFHYIQILEYMYLLIFYFLFQCLTSLKQSCKVKNNFFFFK